jgi:Secretion system C-terminal sorting domain
MKKLIITLLLIFNFSYSNCQIIDTLTANFNSNNLDVKFRVLLYKSSSFNNRISYFFNSNQDTLNVYTYILIGLDGADQVKVYDTTVNIVCSNFAKLCYLNLYSVTDTNSKYYPFDTFYTFYPIDTFSYNFNHCWPLTLASNENQKVVLYPNPCINFISIDNAIKNASAINMQGQAISLKYLVANNNTSINISVLPRGIYFLKFETDTGTMYKKFSKE